MIDFETINVDKVTPEVVNRIQKNIKTAFSSVPTSPAGVPVRTVGPGSGALSDTVRSTDVFVVVNARGGPVRIVLPTPSRVNQAVNILNAYQSNAVTIARADGKAPAIALPAEESALMVCDGKDWFRFRGV